MSLLQFLLALLLHIAMIALQLQCVNSSSLYSSGRLTLSLLQPHLVHPSHALCHNLAFDLHVSTALNLHTGHAHHAKVE